MEKSTTEVPNRFLIVFDKSDEKYPYGYMTTKWTDDELRFRWDVISEHKTIAEAQLIFEQKYGTKS